VSADFVTWPCSCTILLPTFANLTIVHTAASDPQTRNSRFRKETRA
jgi:hypothetical protein